jgi:hypothetical protein
MMSVSGLAVAERDCEGNSCSSLSNVDTRSAVEGSGGRWRGCAHNEVVGCRVVKDQPGFCCFAAKTAMHLLHCMLAANMPNMRFPGLAEA